MTTDRDQSIERLLRRAPPGDPAPAADTCPDAETLAALADDTLPAALRREVEGHVADCSHCQALTAAIARAEAPVGAPGQAAGDMPAWRRRALNWFVPAAAAATAVALWVLVPGQNTTPPTGPISDRQVVEAPPPPLPPPSSEVVTSEPLQIPVDARADEQSQDRDTAAESGRTAPAAPPPPAASPPAAPADPSLKAESGAVGGIQGSAPERRAEVAQSEPAALQERALNRQAAPAAGANAATDTAATRATSGFEVVSPNARIRWRVGPGAIVQYSADGGTTWATQQTGASTELTAGSAPTPEVCWFVGRGGLVLRTANGGRQWQRIPFPEVVDLTAITASTARNATVVLADGRRFATGDGGMTWNPVR